MNFLLVSIVWTVLVIIASLLPGNALPSSGISIPHFDKLVHFVMYAGIVFFWLKYFYSKSTNKQTIKTVLLMVLVGFLMGLIMEFMQHYFIKNRYFESLDLIANGFGCIFGGVIFFKLHNATHKEVA